MKISLPTKRNRGVVLLICLGVAVVITVAFSTYMTTIIGENQAIARAQGWNSSMVLAEAGVEEGLALVNKLVGVSSPTSAWTNTAVSEGWTQSGNVYTLQRSLGNGYYNVWITNVSPTAVSIKSTGTFNFTNGTVQTIQRSVAVTATATSSLQAALLVKGGATLSGPSLFDSYNSLNGPYSLTTHHALANVISMGNFAKSITMSGGSAIYGHVNMAAAGTISWSGSALVGNTNFAGPGVQSGWSANTANITIPDAPALPSVSWLSIPSTPVVINGNNTYILVGGGSGTKTYYQIPSSFNGMSGSAVMLLTNGPIYLDIEGNFQMSGSSQMIVSPGSTLTAWLNGQTPQVSGSGVVNNSGSTAAVIMYGTANCTKIQYSGSSAFIGTLYVPYAEVDWSGSAAIYGAVVAATYVNSGGSAIHYDESLGGPTSSGVYTPSSWAEVSP